MKEIVVATSNELKFRIADDILKSFGFAPKRKPFDITEIQHEDSAIIARDKAQKAFELAGHPIVITDDSWSIPGLNGWPGPYMKSMNYWFTPEDFLRLTLPLADRRAILHQLVVYQDEKQQKLFRVDLEGILQKESRGRNEVSPNLTVISLSPDGRTVAEVENAGELATGGNHTAWHELGAWLREQQA